MGCGFRHQKKSPVSWGLISQSTELQVGGPVSASLNVRQFSCQVKRALWSPGPAVLVLLFPAWHPPCSCNPRPCGLVSPILGRRRLGKGPLPILRPAFRAMFEPGKMPGPPARGWWFLGLGFNSLWAAAHSTTRINRASEFLGVVPASSWAWIEQAEIRRRRPLRFGLGASLIY